MGEIVGQLEQRFVGAGAEDTLARRDDRDQEPAHDVQDEGNAPQLSELQPRAPVAAVQSRDRDQEVLGEELRSADDDEDEADAERDCAGYTTFLPADRRRDERIRDDAERDVEAADERGRGELHEGSRQPPAPLATCPLVDLLGLAGRQAKCGSSSRRAKSRKPSWSGPIWWMYACVYPASSYSLSSAR